MTRSGVLGPVCDPALQVDCPEPADVVGVEVGHQDGRHPVKGELHPAHRLGRALAGVDEVDPAARRSPPHRGFPAWHPSTATLSRRPRHAGRRRASQRDPPPRGWEPPRHDGERHAGTERVGHAGDPNLRAPHGLASTARSRRPAAEPRVGERDFEILDPVLAPEQLAREGRTRARPSGRARPARPCWPRPGRSIAGSASAAGNRPSSARPARRSGAGPRRSRRRPLRPRWRGWRRARTPARGRHRRRARRRSGSGSRPGRAGRGCARRACRAVAPRASTSRSVCRPFSRGTDWPRMTIGMTPAEDQVDVEAIGQGEGRGARPGRSRGCGRRRRTRRARRPSGGPPAELVEPFARSARAGRGRRTSGRATQAAGTS